MADLKWTRQADQYYVAYIAKESLCGWRIVRDKNTVWWHLYKKDWPTWKFVGTMSSLKNAQRRAVDLEDEWWENLVGNVVGNG